MGTRPAIFKWRQTESGLILCAVRWYLRYSLSLRDVEELLEERDLNADHTTVQISTRRGFCGPQMSDLRQRGLVSFRKEQSALDLGFQDTVLRSQIFVPQQQFLIDSAGDVGQHASPVHSRASLKLIVEPGLYMLLRFQKAAVRGNYETGNQAFSKRLRFFTIRREERAIADAMQDFRGGDPRGHKKHCEASRGRAGAIRSCYESYRNVANRAWCQVIDITGVRCFDDPQATIPCGGHLYRPHDQRLGSESRPSSSHCFHALCPAPYTVTSPSTTTATNLLVPTSLNRSE